MHNISLLLFVSLALTGCNRCTSVTSLPTSKESSGEPDASRTKSIYAFISPDNLYAELPAVAVNGRGDAVVAWEQHDGSNRRILIQKKENDVWLQDSESQQEISPSGQDAISPTVAISDNGDAIVAWAQSNSQSWQIFFSLYTAGRWQHPKTLQDHIKTGAVDASPPRVAMNSQGDAVIVWAQSDGINRKIFASVRRNNSWQHPAAVADSVSLSGSDARIAPQAALGENDHAIVIWEQSDGKHIQIFKSEYRDGRWIKPASLRDNISLDGKDAINPSITMDAEGNAIVAWSQDDIFKSEWRGGRWTHPSGPEDAVSPESFVVSDTRVATNAAGDAVIVWLQDNQVFLSERRDGKWLPHNSESRISKIGFTASLPAVAISKSGHAVVAWRQTDAEGGDQIFLSRLHNEKWHHPSNAGHFVSVPGSDARFPAVAMDDAGNGIVVWEQRYPNATRIAKLEFTSDSL